MTTSDHVTDKSNHKHSSWGASDKMSSSCWFGNLRVREIQCILQWAKVYYAQRAI